MLATRPLYYITALVRVMIEITPNKKGIFVKDGEETYLLPSPIFSIKADRHLRNQSIIIGLIGPRGGGKSVGGARLTILDYMLKGYEVWSNMEIGLNLRLNGNSRGIMSKPLNKLELSELDTVYSNGLLFVDEVNAYIADARRAMSEESLAFSYILQEIRKRKLNIIWTAQSEAHCDERLRWQTDIYIVCNDVSVTKRNCGIGELSMWKAYDAHGLVTGQLNKNPIFYEGIIWNKPWWNSFDTWKLQGTEEIDNTLENTADKIEEKVREKGKIGIQYIYGKYGIYDRKVSDIIITLLRKRGIIKDEHGHHLMTLAEYEATGGRND